MNQYKQDIKTNTDICIAPIGIMNMGNTCFLNACIQVFNYTFELQDILKKTDIRDNLDGIITKGWIEIQNLMWSSDTYPPGASLNPSKFIDTFQYVAKEKNRDIFSGWSQNDFSEYLLFMIECFHNSISRKIDIEIRVKGNIDNPTDKIAIQCFKMLKDVYQREYSEIMNQFYGTYVSIITPLNTTSENIIKPELFFLLDLPIPNTHSQDKRYIDIYDCFELFCQKEYVEGDNAWFNEKTGQKENISKQIQFWSLPNILIITFKRFSFDGISKNNTFIDFPLDYLDLSKYVIGYNKETFVYQLYGFCNHYGGITGGHYTSTVRTSNIHSKYTTYQQTASTNWTFFNDCEIKTFTREPIGGSFENSEESAKNMNIHEIVSPNVYCLFYRKIE